MVLMMLTIGSIVLASAALLYVWRVAVVLRDRINALAVRVAREADAGWKRDVDQKLVLMHELLSEGLLHAKRREERARGVVRGALKRLDEAGVEDAAVEAEADELGVGDGEVGDTFQMPRLQDDMADQLALDETSPIPGLSVAESKALLGGQRQVHLQGEN